MSHSKMLCGMSFPFGGTSAYNVNTLEGKECLKENIWSLTGREGMFIVLLGPSFRTHIFINNCYWNINFYFHYDTKLLEWFHQLNLLWKCTEFRLVFLCHKTVKYSDASYFFFPNLVYYFFLKQDSLIIQLPIIPAHLLLHILFLLLM